MITKELIIESKKQWLENGFIGGVITCDFFLMKETGKDIVYDSKDALVIEYKNLLAQRLETNNLQLILMVNTEIEKCLLDNKEEVYVYLFDEIYEHFQNNNYIYPLQAVGLHIDIINTLIYFDDRDKVYDYLDIIKQLHKDIFGKEDYLFCRNWCYILNFVVLKIMPGMAIDEFESNMDLFSKILREDIILYNLYLGIMAKKVKREQKISYMKDAIALCERWCKGVPLEKQKEINLLIYSRASMYYRNIGEYDNAITMSNYVVEGTTDLQLKLFLLTQIGTILFLKHDWKELDVLFNQSANFENMLQEPDENMAELYSILGMYCMKIGNFHKAQIQLDKAITISEELFGKEADTTLKFKCNRVLIEYSKGNFDDAYSQIQKLSEIVSAHPDFYPESTAAIFNTLMVTSFENGTGSKMILKFKNILDKILIKYDIASSVIFKCNFYYIKMIFGDDYNNHTIRELQTELQKYFTQYPYSEGHLIFLRGEYCRLFQEKDVFGTYKILEEMETCLSVVKPINVSREYIDYFVVKLKCLISRQKYGLAKRWLLGLWNNTMLPLIETLIGKKEDDSGYIWTLLMSYISIFISSVRQYSQLRITDKQLYEYVLNYKYYGDLFYYKKSRFNLAVTRKEWLSLEDIELEKESVIVECFFYRKYDMDDLIALWGAQTGDLSSVHHITFGMAFSPSLFRKYNINVISDISYLSLSEKLVDFCEAENFSRIEQEIWNSLKEIVVGKKNIYICADISLMPVPIPLSAMRMNENEYWSEQYQIIYCSVGSDVKRDFEFLQLPTGVYFGMSSFDGEKIKDSQKVQRQFRHLPYVEFEIEKIGWLMKGDVYVDEDIAKTWFSGQRKEIIHISTHAMEHEDDGEKMLVVCKNKNGEYTFLKSSEIAKFDWKGVKLVVLSACGTNEEPLRKKDGYSLSHAVKKSGALYSISTIVDVEDGEAAFFMVCFYKNLLKYRKIGRAFFKTQRCMYTMTKRDILADVDYIDIGMEYYLADYDNEAKPFGMGGSWMMYVLQMN